MGSNTEIDKENIIPSYEHLPEDVRLLLEERKKKRDEEDLQAALASIKVGRCGKVTKIKEIDFTSTSSDASTEVTPAATAPPSGVTMEQIQKLLAERDVYWVNWLSSKERESAGKKPESADEPPSVSTSEFYVPQPSAASPTSQPQYGMPMNYFSGQTVTPTYTDPIMSIPGSANISRTNEIVQYTPPEISRNSVPHTGPISDEMFDRYVQRWQNRQRPVRPVYQPGQTGSPQPVRPVHPVSLFQTSERYLHPHSQILRVISIKCLLIIRMIWLICLEKVLEWMLEVKPAHTKSRILLRLIRLHTLLVLGCLSLLNSVGKILGVLLSILVSILPN